MKKLIFVVLGIFAAAAFFVLSRPIGCKFPANNRLTISTVNPGAFSESIPLTGMLQLDSLNNARYLRVPVDELYLPKIAMGQKATAMIADTVYTLRLNYIYPQLVRGRFNVDMKFDDKTP